MVQGSDFESCTCHNEKATGKERNGTPSHKNSFSQKKLAVVTLVSAKLGIE